MCKFSRRHYVYMAERVAMAPERDRRALCKFLSDAFAADHYKFKPSLFEKACNLPTVDDSTK